MANDKENILDTLSDHFSEDLVTEPDVLKQYGKDWTTQYQPNPVAVVFPKSIKQVQELVKLANQENIALVPSGGRTGLSGGAVAKSGEVVVSFDKMNEIVDFNPIDKTVVCQPGVITQQLQMYATEQGLFYPVDFASSGSSQLGGNIATNAGGIKVIKYGHTREWVRGLKVVTGTGELLELNNGLIKNATGYDLRHLLIGSEGTLGFIVEATMQLIRAPKNLTVMVFAVPDIAATMNVYSAYRDSIDLTAFEFFSEPALQHVLAHHDLQRPFATESPYYALLEFEALNADVIEQVMSIFETCLEKGWASDGVMSQSDTQAVELWSLRENITESIAPYKPYKNDIAVTASNIPAFLDEVNKVVQQHYPEFEIIWFGHIGDGNVHLNVLKPEAMPQTEFVKTCEQVTEHVSQVVNKFSGSISAEHGIGLLKKDFLQYSRSEAEINLMREIKKIFDPKGVMNPNKLFDL